MRRKNRWIDVRLYYTTLPTSKLVNFFFVRKNKRLNYKCCIRYIFPERISVRKKAQSQIPLERFLKHLYNLKSFNFSIVLSYLNRILIKTTPHCSASKALSILPLVKFLGSVFDSLIQKFENRNLFKKEVFCKNYQFRRTLATTPNNRA